MSSYLGQNFLTDSKAKTAIRDLVLKLKIKHNLNSCIEIGPGKGAITKLIQPIFDEHFWAIEKDTTFESILNQIIPSNNIIRNDVLQVDFDKLNVDLNTTLVYGSLPYYITSPIISKIFLNQLPVASSAIGPVNNQLPVGVFIVQKEFAQKVEVNAKKKSFLRRLLNHGHIVTYHKTIKASCFSPAPKVDSAIISIIKSENQTVDYHTMVQVLDKISGFKRKTIGKIIKIVIGYQLAVTDNINELETENGRLETFLGKRLEELKRDEMQVLVEFIYNYKEQVTPKGV